MYCSMKDVLRNIPRREQPSTKDKTKLLLFTRQTFSRIKGSLISKEEESNIVAGFQSLLQLLSEIDAENPITFGPTSIREDTHSRYYNTEHNSTE